MRYFVARAEDRRLDAAARRALRGSFVELSDGVTHYELTGPAGGELAVLVGGLTVPLFYWDGLASRLHSRGVRTLAFSGYGRGYSDRVRAAYDEALFVRQLTELTAALDLTGPHHVIGTSMGALVAMAYAARRPPVSTLTVVGPAGLLRLPLSQRLLLADERLAGFVAERCGQRLLEGHLGREVRDPARGAELAAMVRDAYRFEGSLHAMFSTLRDFRLSGRAELYRRTADLGIPTMLIWGSDDHVTPVEHLDLARGLLRPARCQVVAECGHMPPFERPDVVADQLSSFIASPAERRDS